MDTNVYRIKAGDCVKLSPVNGWGERYAPVADPDVKAAPFQGLRLTLPAERRMPAPLWQAWANLAWDLCRDGAGETREVGVILLRSADPPHDAWRILVPSQTVGAAALAYDLSSSVDIVTGEKCSGIPDGWAHVGTSHSHNEMDAFFSGTDDRDESGIPGAHIVIGGIDKKAGVYQTTARICAGRVFYPLEDTEGQSGASRIVDTTYVAGVAYHATCRDMIHEHETVAYSSYASGGCHDGYRSPLWTADEIAAWKSHFRDDDKPAKRKRGFARVYTGGISEFESSCIDSIAEECAYLSLVGIREAKRILAEAEADERIRANNFDDSDLGPFTACAGGEA